MNTKVNVKNIVVGGLLTAMAILIPLLFAGTPLMIIIPPGFTATITSHVPSMLAMAISPWVAIMVGIGSAIGFVLKVNVIVGARAFIHAIFGGIGAYAYEKGTPFWMVLIITLPIHALLEGLVLLPFGVDLKQALVITSIGTAIHHGIDGFITMIAYRSLIQFSLLAKPQKNI